MPPKKERKKKRAANEEGTNALTMATDVAICGVITPGPKYKLKTLVGHKGHCISKFLSPAYTFRKREWQKYETISPGPKYMLKERKRDGFSFGLAAIQRDIARSPGPKYMLPGDRGVAFSMKWRTNQRKVDNPPAPYAVKPIADAPAFKIGLFASAMKVKVSGGPYTPCNINVVKPKMPVYSIALPCEVVPPPRSPGPVYNVKLPRLLPAFSFGVKHSTCAPPYITECDDRC